jgi:hypothetical protein
MCDRISHEHQYYICGSCFEALVALGPKTDITAFFENDREMVNSEASRAYFEKIFEWR